MSTTAEVSKRVYRRFTEKDYQERTQRLIRKILRFARLLRKNRVPVHTANELAAIAALHYIDISSRFEFYVALKATMVISYKHFPLFDYLFLQFWLGITLPMQPVGISGDSDEEQNSELKQRGAEEDAQGESAENPQEKSDLGDESSFSTYSLVDTFREKDFEKIRPEELAVFDEVFKSLRLKLKKEKKGRRYKSSNRGKIIDLPKSIRQSRQKGGEIIKIFTKEKKPKRSKLLLLVDVSGSMDVYSIFMIKFIYALQTRIRDIETFAFGTRLKRITDLLNYRPIGTALSLLSQNVLFWSGGTDIGGSFLEFNTIYGGKFRKRNRILVILSDGWDKGDMETLKKQMAVFKRDVKKIVWLNPNLKYDSFQPLCMGMATAMPYIDYFLPCHNLKTLEAFIETIKKI